jgi:hypothetical protein
MLSRLFVTAIAGLTGAAAASAQTVRGVLVNEETGAPVGRAYVVLLDSDSIEVTRGFADGLGRFRINAPRQGTYRLRTERIGYRSVVSQAFELADGQDLELEVPVERVLVRLDPLTIEGGRECRMIGDQALEVLTVWEETRKALSAVAWLDPNDQLIHEMDHFERWYTKSFTMVHEVRSTEPTHNVMPFRSRSVEELEESGYVVIEEDSILYEAPDAQVFFSSPFLQHHCFHLDQRRAGGRRKVGLRFEPIEGRQIADVKGVFWLDAETGALENLQIEYVNVGVWQRERGAAGELEFDQLPDERWFVGRWWIRMPVVRRVESMTGAIWHFPEAVVGFYEEGGEVLRVFSVDGRTLYARGRAGLTGVVFDSTTGAGLAGAYVHLAGTQRATYSGADGSYMLTDLPQGRYNVTFSHPLTALIGFQDPPDGDEVRLRDGEVLTANLATPSPETIVGRLCGDAEGEELGLLVGHVRAAAGDSIVAGAEVRIVWLDSGGGQPSPRMLEAETDSLGIYRACVPKAASLSVEATTDSLPLKAVPTTFGESMFHVVDIVLETSEPHRRQTGGITPKPGPILRHQSPHLTPQL